MAIWVVESRPRGGGRWKPDFPTCRVKREADAAMAWRRRRDLDEKRYRVVKYVRSEAKP